MIIQKSPAATILTLAKSISELLNRSNHSINIIGTRHGEKLYETLMSKEEYLHSVDHGNYFIIPSDKRDLNYTKYVETGQEKLTNSIEDYNSHNTERLEKEEMKKLLLKLDLFKHLL